jgi:hypothetical protein
MRASAPAAEFHIPTELQTAWVRQLVWHFDHINYQYLGSKLKRPVFRLSDSRRKLGEWNLSQRTLTISVDHILASSWESVLDTLRHEMAHQYVHEILGLAHAPPHGEAFQNACRLLRCDDSATASEGAVESLDDSDDERDKILGRIKELLALAESPNENEAANAMRMAQKYLIKYNLELDELDRQRDYHVRFLGNCSPRTQEFEYTLSMILQEHFFVLPIWSYSYDACRDKSGKILEICGTSQNLEIASYVWAFVIDVCESLWKTRRRQLQRTRAPGKRGTKFQYLAGVLRGLHEKLDRQRQELVEERGLVLAADAGLGEFFRHMNPRVRSVGTQGVSRNKQYDAGVVDGQKINIHRGVGDPPRNRGRRLTAPES